MWIKWLIITLTVAILSLFVFGPATSEGPPRTRIQVAQSLAHQKYSPACGVVHIGSQPNERNPDGSYVWAEAYGSACRINFTPRGRAISWPFFCTLTVHEYGHLHGLSHVKNRNKIMHAIISYRNLYWRCGKNRYDVHWPNSD